MKNKKIIILATISSSIFLFASYTVYKTTGSHPGSTGAPLEKNCAFSGCHTGLAVINDPIGVNSFSISSIDTTYMPGQTYTISIGVFNPITTKFGFEVTAIKNSDSLAVGNFGITDAPRTQILSYNVGTNLRYSITHTSAGTPAISSGYNQWDFIWTAPATNVGLITFYYGTNCTNNNGAKTGDQIYTSKFTIKPKSLVSVNEFIDNNDIKTFYNPETREINLSYNLKFDKSILISLVDNLGKEVMVIPVSNKTKGQNKELISIEKSIKAGLYFVNIIIDNSLVSQKILIQ